jgi:hypothetical protein
VHQPTIERVFYNLVQEDMLHRGRLNLGSFRLRKASAGKKNSPDSVQQEHKKFTAYFQCFCLVKRRRQDPSCWWVSI